VFKFEGEWVDLTRMRIEARLDAAPEGVEKELAESLLILYDQGAIDVSTDLWTGELKFRAAYIN
jgi:hypothetical protein